ncbi:MAG: hypothetical protein AAB341_04345 [Planctomycetota bacterium]
MPSLKPVYFFVLKVAIIYGVLLIPWPGVMTGYRVLFCAGGNTFFRTLGGDGRVYFRALEHPTRTKDIEAKVENVRTRTTGTLEKDSRMMGYLPTCFTISLIAATPIPWCRKGVALLAGVALISMFAGLQIWLFLMEGFSSASPLAVYTLSPFWRKAIIVLIRILYMTPVTAYIAPVIIWALICIRREDLQRFLPQSGFARVSPVSQAARS